MEFVKKDLIILVLAFVLALNIVLAEEKIASVEENSLSISAPEITYCQGTTCTIEYTILNLGDADKKVSVSNIFHSELVTPLKLEKYGEITETKTVNTPVKCACSEKMSTENPEVTSEETSTENSSEIIPEENTTPDLPLESETNETITTDNTELTNSTSSEPVCYCDDISTYDYTYEGFSEISSDKDSTELKSKKDNLMTLEKGKEQKFQTTIYQPLGQKTKYDITAENEDGTTTMLDPWADSSNYYINLSNYRYELGTLNSTLSYNLDDNLIDSTGTQNLTAYGSPVFTNGFIGSCVKGFSDTTYLNTGGLSSFTNYYALSVWINGSFTNDYSSLLGKNANGGLEGMASGAVRFYAPGASGAATGGSVLDGHWHNVIGTFDGYHARLYIDGYYVSSYNQSINVTSLDLNIGFSGVSSRYWTGSIDEARIFRNRNLTATEIYNIYNVTKTNYITNAQNLNENLTINSTYLGVIITYNSEIINQFNDSALGNNLISGTCYPLLQTALNWSISANINYSKDLSRAVNYTFNIECYLTNESSGKQAILEGIIDSGKVYNPYYDKKVYIRLANTTQYNGTFDVFITIGNKRYAFNYDQNSSASFPTMFNISPVFYVWQNYNMTYYSIKTGVQALIDSTN